MARIRRLIPPEAAMHIMCRGNNKQVIFNNDESKVRYYWFIRKFKKENNISIFHYCIMNNHLHLVVWLEAESRLSRFMKQLNLCYFNYFSKAYDYCGHLWQGRFKSNLIDTDSYLLQCGKYVELNPVRAGLVDFPEDYHFSSYNHYAKGVRDPIITDDPIYISLANTQDKRRQQYIEFVVDSSIIRKNSLKKGRPRIKIETSPFSDEK
ncbi:MAG: transposase [Candidatus Omnitrophota bacterium]